VALLTVTVEEFDGVSQIFDLRQNLAGSAYFVHAVSEDSSYDLVLRRLPGQTNTLAAEGTGATIEDFRPEFLILIGTCGGHSERGALLGDVVIADYVDFSGYWKYKKGAVLRRKTAHDHPSGYLLQNFVEPLRVAAHEWVPRIVVDRPEAGIPKLLVGGIVSGDVLLGNPANAEQRRILRYFDKACAFEMEGYGVARAVYNARNSVQYNPQFLIVRGVSDLVNENAAGNQAIRAAWTPYSVAAAGTFGVVLVEKILAVAVPEVPNE
jgi:nucleoside phosphorylase